MPAPLPLSSTCDIYRPAGAGAATYEDVPCRLVPNMKAGRSGASESTNLGWTHYLDLADDVDIRDGCTRSVGTDYVSYADGDGVRVTMNGQTWRFVVVWVEWRYPDEPENAYIRAYLIRDLADWY